MARSRSLSSNSSLIIRSCSLQVFLALLLLNSIAQATTTTSSTDGYTPPSLTAGAPAGSYSLSGFENVNLFNGNLNFNMPLLHVGGRGDAQYTMYLSIEEHWRILHTIWSDESEFWLPVDSTWYGEKPRYGPGLMRGRTIATGTCAYASSVTALTRFTFILSDGTEFELRDQQTGGNGQTVSCSSGGYNRGTIFVTADGTAATFVSDAPVIDYQGTCPVYPTGYLTLRNGLRYRIDQGHITWMRDRNGNKLTFTYGQVGVTSITDSLNRQITVSYADLQTVFYDQISFKGFGGAARTIRVNYSNLASVLRTDRTGDLSTVQTLHALFPELDGSTTTTHNPYVVASVLLPDGAQQFQFRYNVYAELARVILPTGGMFEYDFGAATGSGDGVVGLDEIDRRVSERRLYRDGANLEGRTDFGRPADPYYASDSAVLVDKLDAAGTTLLAREKHYFYGGTSVSNNTFEYSNWLTGKEYKTEEIDTANCTIATCASVLKRVEYTWQQGCTVSSWSSLVANNPRLTDITTTLVPTNQVSKQTFGYDCANNKTDSYDYDFGSGAAGALLRRSHTDYVTSSTYTSAASGPHLRSLPTQTSVYNNSGIERARTTFEYDNYTPGSPHAYLTNRSGISGFDSSFTTAYVTRGNATAVTQYLLNTSGGVTGSISSYAQYDIAGNVVASIDPRGNTTSFDFTDRFGAPDGEAESNSAPSALNGQYTFAIASQITYPMGGIVFVQSDYYLGVGVEAEDLNGTVYSSYYADALDRPTKMIRGANRDVLLKSQSLFSYDDVNHIITTTSDQTAFHDLYPLKSTTNYDGLGRPIESRTYEDSTKYIAVQKTYDALGRAYRISNPFRPLAPDNQTPVWSTTGFDALGRLTSLTTPDGAVAQTSYNGNTITSTDQNGKARKSVLDALGRATAAYEDPAGVNYQTSYAYDELDDLTTVTQGTQTRTFAYDTLKRLSSMTNPENGTVSFTYDNNGNLLTRVDARNITTTLTYDALNRPQSKTYQNDGGITPAVNFYYDNQTLPTGAPSFSRGSAVGRLVAVTYGGVSAGDYYGYDFMGHPVLKVQQTGSVNYQIAASYNNAGALTGETYPSNRTVSFGYDQAARMISAAGTLGDGTSRTYSSGITYSALGGLQQEQLGTDTPLYNKLFYNVRGQLSEIRESTTANNTSWNRGAIINQFSNNCWGMCGGSNSTTPMTDNNGTLKRQDIYIPDNDQVSSYSTWADGFSYDNLNRLTQIHEYTGNTSIDSQQEYLYDQWGNRRINQSTTWGTNIPKPDFSVNASNNRLTPPGGYTMTYDAAGNLTNDTYSGQGQRTYDAENRMTQAWANSQWQTYTYDGTGQRIKRNVSAVETWQVYGFGGELLAEYAANGSASAPQKEYGYRNGQLLITAATQSQSTQNVSFTSMVGVTASGNNLTKTAGNGWGNGGAVSTQAIASGDGYAEFSAGSLDYGMYGLSHGDTDQGYPDIDFALYTERAEGRVYVYENGVNRGQVGTFVNSDRFRVAIEGGVVKYRKNGTLLYTSSVAPVYPLLVDTSLCSGGNTLSNVVISGNLSGVSGTEISWVVTDQLGTPRMIFGKSGSLATTKRHDYLPFGEELAAGQGLRTGTQGYVVDGVRQHFTGYERDLESGLDYAHARYFSSGQGRFTGVDPVGGSPMDPQSWNRYSYVGNNPLTRSDPTGMVARESLVYNNTRGSNTFDDFARLGDIFTKDEYVQSEAEAASATLGSGARETGEPQTQGDTTVEVKGAYIDPAGVSGKISLDEVTFRVTREAAPKVFGEDGEKPFIVSLNIRLPEHTTELTPTKYKVTGLNPRTNEKGKTVMNKTEFRSGSYVTDSGGTENNFSTGKGVVTFSEVNLKERTAVASFMVTPKGRYDPTYSNSFDVTIKGQTTHHFIQTTIRVTILSR